MSLRTQSPRSVAARTRTAVLAAFAVVAMVVVAAVPASAAEGLGEKQGWGIPGTEIALLFVGIPALVFAVVFALVYGTSRKAEPRLREGQDWWSAPDYHAVNDGAPAAGATEATSKAPRTTDGGGTGASW